MSHFDLDLLRARVGIDPAKHSETLSHLADGKIAWVIVSGKMTAGKDTIAPELSDLTPTAPVMLRYGNLMRAELDPALDLIRESLAEGTSGNLADQVSDLMNLPGLYARELVDVLVPEMVASTGTLTAHSRTEGVRRILINLGDHWRCADDGDYWARSAAVAAFDALDQGSSVILTGGRFLPDVDIPRAAGAFLLRLDVTRQTQLARLRGRDNIDPSPETLAAMDHVSETELDDYAHFDARIDNNGELADALAASRAALTANLTGRSTRAA